MTTDSDIAAIAYHVADASKMIAPVAAIKPREYKTTPKYRAAAAAYRAKHPDYLRNYRKENSDKIAAGKRRWSEKNPGYYKTYQQQYKAKDPEGYRARGRAWYHANKGRLGVIKDNSILSATRTYVCKTCGEKGTGKCMVADEVLDIYCRRCWDTTNTSTHKEIKWVKA